MAVTSLLELCFALGLDVLAELVLLFLCVTLLNELLEDGNVRLSPFEGLGTSTSPIEFFYNNQSNLVHLRVSFGLIIVL